MTYGFRACFLKLLLLFNVFWRLSPLITLMARSYPGIFQLFFELDEAQFCKRLNITSGELEKQLKELEKMGVCDISWRSSLPAVTLTHERLPDDYIRLNSKIYFNRKKLALERLKAMKNYATMAVCRNINLLHYFSQPAEKCGVCDICVLEKNKRLKVEIEKDMILSLEKPLSFNELMHELKVDAKALNYLLRKYLLDEKITIENEKYVLYKKSKRK